MMPSLLAHFFPYGPCFRSLAYVAQRKWQKAYYNLRFAVPPLTWDDALSDILFSVYIKASFNIKTQLVIEWL